MLGHYGDKNKHKKKQQYSAKKKKVCLNDGFGKISAIEAESTSQAFVYWAVSYSTTNLYVSTMSKCISYVST